MPAVFPARACGRKYRTRHGVGGSRCSTPTHGWLHRSTSRPPYAYYVYLVPSSMPGFPAPIRKGVWLHFLSLLLRPRPGCLFSTTSIIKSNSTNAIYVHPLARLNEPAQKPRQYASIHYIEFPENGVLSTTKRATNKSKEP